MSNYNANIIKKFVIAITIVTFTFTKNGMEKN